jgi:hypothetical protein
MNRPDGGKGTGWALLGMLLVSCSQFAWVKATNFGGWDEWLVVSLAAERIVDHPYVYRPLGLLWHVSAALAKPHDLRSYLILHAVYIGISGWLVFTLCRYLAPQARLWAFLAGALSVVWAPMDSLRLNALDALGYSGATLATLSAIVLVVESWSRKSPAILAVAGLAAVLAAGTNEVTLPLLAAAPLAVLWVAGERTRRQWLWVACWTTMMLLLGGVIFHSFLDPLGSGSYQLSALHLDLSPLSVVRRWVQLFGFHLLPLVTTPVQELAVPAVPAAIGVFILAWRGAVGPLKGAVDAGSGHLRLAGLGLVLAGLGNGLFALSPALVTPNRTQFLSSPGIAVFLASAVCLLTAGFNPRWRVAAALLAGAWVVALATGRVVALQREWDKSSYWRVQNRTLVELTRRAPDLKPNTFVILIDEGGAWPASFTFRHALRYLYAGHAIGSVWRANDFLYPVYLLADGVHSVPWEIIRKPWRTPVTTHGYRETVVVRLEASGTLSVLQRWPDELLPKLPEGAAYEPEGRILRQETPDARRILRPD